MASFVAPQENFITHDKINIVYSIAKVVVSFRLTHCGKYSSQISKISQFKNELFRTHCTPYVLHSFEPSFLFQVILKALRDAQQNRIILLKSIFIFSSNPL